MQPSGAFHPAYRGFRLSLPASTASWLGSTNPGQPDPAVLAQAIRHRSARRCLARRSRRWSPRLLCAIDERPAHHRVGYVPLLFQTAQHRADRGILQFRATCFRTAKAVISPCAHRIVSSSCSRSPRGGSERFMTVTLVTCDGVTYARVKIQFLAPNNQIPALGISLDRKRQFDSDPKRVRRSRPVTVCLGRVHLSDIAENSSIP